MRVCWIGIGGNLGDSHEVFDAAWAELAQQADLQLGLRSGIYHTSPVGQHAGDTFSNGVFSLSTTLTPAQLLVRLQAIEFSLGRRKTVRWGNRPIDLDLLFVDQSVMDEPSLTIPHRAAWYRRFVIDPLFEVSPTLRHPLINQTIAELKDRLSTRPLIIACLDLPLLNDRARFCSSSDRSGVPRTWSPRHGRVFDRGHGHPEDGESVAPKPKPKTSRIALGHLESMDFALRFPDVRFVASDEPASIGFQLGGVPRASTASGIPIADLTNTPGDANQRITDFLTSVLDEPQRVSDW